MVLLAYSGRAVALRLVTGLPKTSRDGIAQLASVLATLQRASVSYGTAAARGRPVGISNRSSMIGLSRRTYATRDEGPAATTKKARSTPKKGKTAAKAAPNKKKKAAPKKKKPAVKAKKVLTEEEKTKAEIKRLKAAALSEPKGLPRTAWSVLSAEMAQVSHSLQSTEASARYKALTPVELEHYNHLANQNKATTDEVRKKWIESFTPDQIREANNARRRLKRLLNRPQSYHLIKDERQPKRALSPYVHFYLSRVESGDLKHMSVGDRSRLVRDEWKGLTDAEKQQYIDRSATDASRYRRDFKAAFNRESTGGSRASSP
ncbi:MAG: hypothetical protein M1832_005058 [Thelocarpon impressellum]|nr:MAG: hypothetical protein M1832_005058 [Thelocarpon impressellum]